MASIPVWLPATPLAALPPNAGARSVGPPVADATFAARIPTSALPRLAAVVTGFHPYALLTAGSSVRIVTVGDVIAGKRVEQIAERRLLLAGGARLDVDPSAHAVAVH
ncbi:MAG: hypothetical protein JOZ24_02465 [Candidatus Eremiobacteraeota bacterium]|nr:hypothetical protein [Candidatus Eremiobacteraeota bacterium]